MSQKVVVDWCERKENTLVVYVSKARQSCYMDSTGASRGLAMEVKRTLRSSSSSLNSASQLRDDAVLTQTDSLLEIEEAASAASAVHSLDPSEDDRSADPSIAIVKVLPPSDRNLQPKAAAVEYLGRFVQTLQWKGQQLACREIGTEFITQFSSWYYECKGICEAKKDVSYCPGSCKVTIPLQAMKGVDESPAFLALKAEVADISNRCKIDLGKQYLKSRIQISSEFPGIPAIPLLSSILRRIPFLLYEGIYRKVIEVTKRNAKVPLFNLAPTWHFHLTPTMTSDDESYVAPSQQAISLPTLSAVSIDMRNTRNTLATAKQSGLMVPLKRNLDPSLKLRSLNNERKKINLTELLASHTPLNRFIDTYKRVNDCGRAPADHMELYCRRFPEKTAPSEAAKDDSASAREETATAVAAANLPPPQSGTARKSSEGVSRSLNYEESAAAEVPPLDAATAAGNMIPPSTSKTPSQPPADASKDSDLKTLLCCVLAIGSKDSPAIQQLLHSCPEIAGVAETGKLLSSGKQSTSNNPSTPTKTPKPIKPAKHLSPPRCMWNPYQRRYYFTREETEEEKALLFASVTKAERILDCEHECLLNSIHETNFVDAAKMPRPVGPPDGSPPGFDETLAEDLPMEVVTNALQANPATNIMSAVDCLWKIVETLFIKSPAVFVNQQIMKKKEADISALELKSSLDAKATAVATATTSEPVPTSRSMKVLISQEVAKASTQLKRNLTSKTDQIHHRLQKYDAELHRVKKKARSKSNSDTVEKESRRPATGAKHTNQTGKQRHLSHNPPSAVAPNARNRTTPKSILKQPTASTTVPTSAIRNPEYLGGSKKWSRKQHHRSKSVQLADVADADTGINLNEGTSNTAKSNNRKRKRKQKEKQRDREE
eukprot:scaffold21438_cov60-Cyclotella_meneghiniana.AAC.2